MKGFKRNNNNNIDHTHDRDNVHVHDNRRNQGHFANLKDDLTATAGEFIGTVLFLLFALGAVQTVTTNQNQLNSPVAGTQVTGSDAGRLIGYYYISASFGFSLAATAFIFYRFTGSIFNPSVSLALCLVGAIKPVRFIMVATAQMVGGIVAAAILDGLTPGPLSVGVALGRGTNRAQGLFIEMFTTSALVLSVLMLAAEKHLLTPFAPLGFGLMLFITILFSVQFTGGAVNTARAFGPACIEGFPNYHWIYWLGPTLGALIATGFYTFLKKIHYWRVTPGQDSTDARDAPMQEDHTRDTSIHSHSRVAPMQEHVRDGPVHGQNYGQGQGYAHAHAPGRDVPMQQV